MLQKNRLSKLIHFLYRSRKTLFLLIGVVSIPIVLNIIDVGTIYITGVETYGSDIKFTSEMKFTGATLTLDWGTVYLTDSKNVSFYLKSTHKTPITLSFNVTKMSPEGLRPYMNLSWNYSGTQIAPNDEIAVTFNLRFSPSIDLRNYLFTNNVTSFNFEISIYALS
jgi:hypothetical protein